MNGEPPSTPPDAKPLHPLQGFCWMWLVASIFVGGIGGLIIHSCFYPQPRMLERVPRGDGLWMELGIIGFGGIVIGLAYLWFWHRLAVLRNLTRKTWRTGTGLLLFGAVFLFFTGWLLPSVGLLLSLALWSHGHTRQFFEQS